MTALPLVFVPALGSDERLWQPVADLLADSIETVVVRGEGSSISAMADSVLEQCPPRFAVAGNSMGSYVALEIALRMSPRVHGLALLNSSAIAADAGRRENSRRIIEMVRGGRFDEAVTAMSGAVAPRRPEVADLAATMARDLGEDVLVAQQVAVMTRHDRRDELSSLTVPTLVIAGTDDAITPSDLGREVTDLVPGAELVVLAGVGHLSTLEAPESVAANLARWHAALTHSVART
ncbi:MULTISPECIES: alpha/beta fold hydrolase [unclassified Rhodococcus (in: high G+C Gram-positive bacteria)]|uniref:alpha/beta fold hydrolase n=1 Tax=unclassified Rhodococcus (in: high G+C Gram-positive bacteria) TaxID=192944 RepID=UPI0007017E2A|nr:MULTISPECIES: alpha/beta fold hydrolase [unclassified Rhodococcus (in: high G+C Gram-positive bacteria)]KQU38435.1 hydrolase [Rhodococcus sp. Leaf225]KQU39798.1 hydrolase [Rhodococcus sp. Leaf258]